MRRSAARISVAATAGADVKLTASNSRMGDLCDQLVELAARPVPDSSGKPGSGRARRRRSAARRGTPETDPSPRWRRAAAPRYDSRVMPESRRYCTRPRARTRILGDHSSRRPAARNAPVALGPRATIRALDNAAVNRLRQSPAVGGGDPAAKSDTGRRDHDVWRIGHQSFCVAAQFVIVGQRDHGDRRGAGDGGAVAVQQRAQLAGTPRRGDCHPIAGERRRGWVIHMNYVCPPNFGRGYRPIAEALLACWARASPGRRSPDVPVAPITRQRRGVVQVDTERQDEHRAVVIGSPGRPGRAPTPTSARATAANRAACRAAYPGPRSSAHRADSRRG